VPPGVPSLAIILSKQKQVDVGAVTGRSTSRRVDKNRTPATARKMSRIPSRPVR
jgi:hypothetical protein